MRSQANVPMIQEHGVDKEGAGNMVEREIGVVV